MNNENLLAVIGAFAIEGEVEAIHTFGNGLINSTYRVITKSSHSPDYVLQSINTAIFTDVAKLTSNLERVTAHIRSKIEADYSLEELNRHCLTIIPSKSGKNYFYDSDGNDWRVFALIEGSKTIELLENERQAELAGKAFGEFHSLLIDLPQPALHEVLPGFHNTAKRIDNFKARVQENPVGRLAEVQEEVDFLLEFEQEMKSIIQLGEAGKLPLRTVHQDTKINNILFDTNDEVLCVIDLDTVMPGYLCYDFGDAVRTGMNTGKEDDEDLDNVKLDLALFKGFAKGYFKASKLFITPAEVDTLAFGGKLLTYEQAVRFLDDYLNGDQYYQTTKPKHNLIRTRAQIKYLKELILNFSVMDNYVKGLYKGS